MSLAFAALQSFLLRSSGLSLDRDKQYLVDARLRPVARQAGLASLNELILKIETDRALAKKVTEAMTINETFFFRDRQPFEGFRKAILPELLKARAKTRRLRIWSAACSTGQEPYSLAMILDEEARALMGWTVEIVATDIADSVLKKAREGAYTHFEVQRGMPMPHLVRYFTKRKDHWTVNQTIKARVDFRQQNLMADFSHLGVFDVIFCRNVLIYFDQDTKAVIFERMAKSLEADGTLLLGAAESVVGITDAFRPISDRRGLYQLNPARSGRAMGGLMPQPLKVAAAR
jgi:chemotaxis protein methyltransferase CheR